MKVVFLFPLCSGCRLKSTSYRILAQLTLTDVRAPTLRPKQRTKLVDQDTATCVAAKPDLDQEVNFKIALPHCQTVSTVRLVMSSAVSVQPRVQLAAATNASVCKKAAAKTTPCLKSTDSSGPTWTFDCSSVSAESIAIHIAYSPPNKSDVQLCEVAASG